MKNILRTMIPAVLLVTFLSGSALAQTKVATVDLQKLFENYWKTRQAKAAIDDQITQQAKDEASMKDDLKKATDKYQQDLAQANDQAISADERDRRKQAAADELKQLQQRQGAIDQASRTAQARIGEQSQHLSEKIRADIMAHIATAAKAGGYPVVLNTAAEGFNLGTGRITVPSPIVYSISEIDLTDAVLKQLNAGAPIDMTSANSAPVVSPVPSLRNTNGP